MNLIATNVRKIIAEKGYKQYVVAERAGYTQRAFSDMLNGRKVIKAVDILAISEALQTSPNEICGWNSDFDKAG